MDYIPCYKALLSTGQTSWKPRQGTPERPSLPPPLSPWRAVLTTGLGPVSPRVGGSTPNPGESCAFITIPCTAGPCNENLGSPGARVPWVLILAMPPKNHVAWVCQLTSGPWIHRAPISQRLQRHSVTLAVTWCNLWHHVTWDQNLRISLSILQICTWETQSKQGMVCGETWNSWFIHSEIFTKCSIWNSHRSINGDNLCSHGVYILLRR